MTFSVQQSRGTSPVKLSKCPFCGDVPSFSSSEFKDDNRYVEMTLECCIRMSASIPYGQFKSMTSEQIDLDLRNELVAKWEDRAPADEPDVAVVEYNTDDPIRTGVYACRVPSDRLPGLHEDKFLMWMDGRWSYPGSDQNYRGDVDGWVGPLQRRMKLSSVG
jgi:hypothetical protein